LDVLLAYPTKAEIEGFIEQTVCPALEKVAAAIRQGDHEAKVETLVEGTDIRILHGDETDFLYAIEIRPMLQPDFSYVGGSEEGKRFYRAEVHLLEGSQHYDVYGFSEEQLIHDILSQYDKHVHFLNIARA